MVFLKIIHILDLFFLHIESCNKQADEEILKLDLYFQVSVVRTRCTVHIVG